jgi:CheY-like chemotaxis protein
MTATAAETGHSGGSRENPEISRKPSGGGNEDEAARVHLCGLAYLVVDDSRFARALIKSILHGFGIRNLIECESAKQALGMLQSTKIDVILADFEMPEMTGVEFTWRLRRSKDELVQRIPVIMVSTHADESRIRLAINSGVNEYLPKPFAPADLYARIERSVLAPKPFIVAPGYIGPDRRFADGGPENGIERRGGLTMPATLIDFTGPEPREIAIAKPGMAPPASAPAADAGTQPAAPPSPPSPSPSPPTFSALSESTMPARRADGGIAAAVKERIDPPEPG